MNREFMQYMREHHPEASQQHFNMTVLNCMRTTRATPKRRTQKRRNPKRSWSTRARGRPWLSPSVCERKLVRKNVICTA